MYTKQEVSSTVGPSSTHSTDQTPSSPSPPSPVTPTASSMALRGTTQDFSYTGAGGDRTLTIQLGSRTARGASLPLLVNLMVGGGSLMYKP